MGFQGVQDVEVSDVQVLRDTGRFLLCRMSIAGGSRMVAVPARQLQAGSTARRSGDCGKLVIPQWLAVQFGLEGPAGSMTAQAGPTIARG